MWSIIHIHLMNASEAEGSREVVRQPRSPSMGWPRSCLLSVATPRNLGGFLAHLFTHGSNEDKPYMLNDQLCKGYPTSYSKEHSNQEVQNEITFWTDFPSFRVGNSGLMFQFPLEKNHLNSNYFSYEMPSIVAWPAAHICRHLHAVTFCCRWIWTCCTDSLGCTDSPEIRVLE